MAQIHALTPDGRLPSAAQQHVRELVPHPATDVETATNWMFAESDDAGALSRAVDEQGRTWLSLHPDSRGVVAPGIADQIRDTPGRGWAWAVTDASGAVALGVRDDGSVYPGEVADPFDVLLVIGQSNAQGAGKPLLDEAPDPRVWQYPAASKPQTGIVPAVDPMPHQGPITSNTGTGPGIAAARAYADAHPGRRVLLVPAAYSQTGFSSAGPNTWDWESTEGGDNLAVRAVAQTRAALAAAGEGARLAGILWHQGEGDQSIAADYAAKLDGLIAWLRDQFDAPEVPFVVGQMGYERGQIGTNAIIIDKAHMMTPARNPRVGFARTVPGVHNPGDVTHLSTRGQALMGAAMGEALERARYALPGTPPLGVENLTATAANGSTVATWEPAWGHVTSYRVEWSTDGTTWTTDSVDQYTPLDLRAVIPAQFARVRVTAVNSTGDSETVYARGGAA